MVCILQVHIDVVILSVLDIVASLFCSITIFSVLGAMAHDLKLDGIDSIVSPGGLLRSFFRKFVSDICTV